MSFDGKAERAAIMTRYSALAGGRGFKTEVPGTVTLPRFTDQRIKPYYVVRFATPFATERQRSIMGEAAQPHILAFTVLAYGGDADAAEALQVEVAKLSVGWQPTPNATPIKATGGYAQSVADTGSYPMRFLEMGFYRTIVNLTVG